MPEDFETKARRCLDGWDSTYDGLPHDEMYQLGRNARRIAREREQSAGTPNRTKHKKPGCARGRVTIECGVAGHYELRIRQTDGPLLDGHEASADVCMTRGELRALGTMIGKMFPERPNRVDLDLSGAKPDNDQDEPSVEVDGEATP